METKKCTTCKIEQPLSEYRKDSSRSNGIHTTCNNCNKKIQRNWYKNNKEKAKRLHLKIIIRIKILLMPREDRKELIILKKSGQKQELIIILLLVKLQAGKMLV